MSAKPAVEALFAEYDRHPGDRERLLRAVASWRPFERVLYAGSYIDASPSFVFPHVTYVDTDRRAARFFADRPGVDRLIGAPRADAAKGEAWRFLHADYTERLDVPDGSIDLLLSLYAGFVSEHCTRYLRAGGCLLANNSHGDASLASLECRYRLVAVVTKRVGVPRRRGGTRALPRPSRPRSRGDRRARAALRAGGALPEARRGLLLRAAPLSVGAASRGGRRHMR